MVSSAGSRARNRGNDFERTVAKYFGGERVPFSGSMGRTLGQAWLGDVKLGDLQVQCKKTTALTTQRKWLDHDGSDILVQGNPRERVQDALVVMRASTFKKLLTDGGLLQQSDEE